MQSYAACRRLALFDVLQRVVFGQHSGFLFALH